MAAHPRARARAAIVAPSGADTYRYSNALAYTQFEKYPKLGYDVAVDIVNAQTPLFGALAPGEPHPGSIWWEAHKRACCPSNADFSTYFAKVCSPEESALVIRIPSNADFSTYFAKGI